MDDRTMVTAITNGDPRGLDSAYRRYADRLYTYCRGLLGDPDAAADAVHDTFLIASRKATDLRDPDRLQAWLYTIARHECHRVQRAGKRRAPLSAAAEPEADAVDPGRDVQTRQLRDLVRSATAALSEADREVIELALRHGLNGVDLGAVLGVSANHAHARLSRARSALQRALGAVLVARAAAPRCAELDAVLLGWDGTMTPLLRKRVSRHIDRCPRCGGAQAALLNPAELLPAFAGLPLLAVPAAVWPRLARRSAADPGPVPRPAEREGPRPSGSGRLRVAGSVAAVVVIAIGIGVGATLARADRPAPVPRAGADQPASDLRVPDPSTAGSPAAGAPSAGPSLVAPPAVPPSSPPSSPTGEPLVLTGTLLTVTATGAATCLTGSRFELRASATTNRPVAKALLYWTTPATKRTAMTRPTSTTAKGTTSSTLASSMTWWVEVATSDGRTAKTSPRTVSNPC